MVTLWRVSCSTSLPDRGGWTLLPVYPAGMSSPRRMLEACGCAVFCFKITPEMTHSTLIVDAYWEPASVDRRGEKRSIIFAR